MEIILNWSSRTARNYARLTALSEWQWISAIFGWAGIIFLWHDFWFLGFRIDHKNVVLMVFRHATNICRSIQLFLFFDYSWLSAAQRYFSLSAGLYQDYIFKKNPAQFFVLLHFQSVGNRDFSILDHDLSTTSAHFDCTTSLVHERGKDYERMYYFLKVEFRFFDVFVT